jgi:hypothetical protein
MRSVTLNHLLDTFLYRGGNIVIDKPCRPPIELRETDFPSVTIRWFDLDEYGESNAVVEFEELLYLATVTLSTNPALQSLLDNVLIDGLPPTLKQAIDDTLRKGGTHAEILRRARNLADGTLTLDAIEAYLRTK